MQHVYISFGIRKEPILSGQKDLGHLRLARVVVWEQENGSPVGALPPPSWDCVRGGLLSLSAPLQSPERNQTKNEVFFFLTFGDLLQLTLHYTLPPGRWGMLVSPPPLESVDATSPRATVVGAHTASLLSLPTHTLPPCRDTARRPSSSTQASFPGASEGSADQTDPNA